MDKSPAFFVKTSIVDRNIAFLNALLHLVRIHADAPQFARIDLTTLSPDMRDMVLQSEQARLLCYRDYLSPIYDNDIATLLAVAGIEVMSRDRTKQHLQNSVKNLQELDIP